MLRFFHGGLGAKEFFKRLVKQVRANAMTDRAAQLAYYFVFALFPALFFLVTLAAYLPVQGATDDLLARLDQIMPEQAFSLVRDEILQLTTQQRPHFLTLGLLLALWSASSAVDSLRVALNLSYDVRETRPFWKTRGLAIVLTIATSALVIASVGGFALGGDLGSWLAGRVHVDKQWAYVWSWLRWPITAGFIMFVAANLYYFLPDVKQEWKFITPGSVVGTLLWLFGTYGFTYYVEHFGSYQKTYGSIGGVIVLLTWLWLSGLVFLLGGEINALLEHAARDGKAKGARAAGEAPEPRSVRPSAAPPGLADSAEVNRDQSVH